MTKDGLLLRLFVGFFFLLKKKTTKPRDAQTCAIVGQVTELHSGR